MDYKVEWSPEALRAAENIANYIAHDSIFYSNLVMQKITAAATSLKQFPHRGRVVPEIKDEKFREIFVYEYRIIYVIQDTTVLIVNIFHGRRMLDPEADIKTATTELH